jgi:thioredoxin reductase (NADPH)
MINTDLDCLIIGGGPAGLTAAVYLARYHRRVAVFDAGHSRARYIPESHNYPGFPDGVSGETLLANLVAQATRYGVAIVGSKVRSLRQAHPGFRVLHDQGELRARFVLVATGIVDTPPVMDGLDAAIADGLVRYCPVCDAYEATDKRIAVYGSGRDAAAKAKFMRTYSAKVTWLRPSGHDPCAEDLHTVAEAGIAIVNSVDKLQREGPRIRALSGANAYLFDLIYPALGCDVRSRVASDLGAAVTSDGCLKVDEHQRTTIEGLYAAGDVVSDLHQISVATGHAAIAATHIHKSLPASPRDNSEGATARSAHSNYDQLHNA